MSFKKVLITNLYIYLKKTNSMDKVQVSKCSIATTTQLTFNPITRQLTFNPITTRVFRGSVSLGGGIFEIRLTTRCG